MCVYIIPKNPIKNKSFHGITEFDKVYSSYSKMHRFIRIWINEVI